MTPIVLLQQTTQTLQFGGLKVRNGAYINDATVAVTLYDEEGSIRPELNASAMGHVGGSNGCYAVTLAGASFNPPEGYSYSLVLNAASGGGNTLHLELPAIVRAPTLDDLK